MSENSPPGNYLLDLGYLLLERARAAKADADKSGDPYERGRQFGLYEAVSIAAQQADAFGLDPREVGLAGVDPGRDLL